MNTLRLLSTCVIAAWLLMSNPAMASPESSVTDSEILLGQSLGLTGPLAALTKVINDGVCPYVNELSNQGGTNWHKLKVVTADHSYVNFNTTKNFEQLIVVDNFFAPFDTNGTTNTYAVFPIVQALGISLFSPITGTQSVRV